jgi:uncharacterized protein YgbK (DUF1537 family)
MGKKLIVADSASLTDVEQVMLAINKSNYKILPAGTAATGKMLAKLWLPENDEECEKVVIPKLPRLIISGSATNTNSVQIEQLEQSYDYDNIHSIPITSDMVVSEIPDEFVQDIANKLDTQTVVVHSSKLLEKFDGFSEHSLKEELTRAKFASKITDYLAELTKRIIEKKQVLLITLGGETSYKCCNAISAKELSMIEEVAPAIALCKDFKNQYIITKSGNLGNPKTLIEILNFVDKHEQ